MLVTTNSPAETQKLAIKIMQNLPSDVHCILLSGDLAAGKTTLAKGVGEFLQVKKVINSPTYTILKSYQGFKDLHHFDLYRLNLASDTLLEYEEIIFDADSISVIEWPENAMIRLPNKYLKIQIKIISENVRSFDITPIGFAGFKI